MGHFLNFNWAEYTLFPLDSTTANVEYNPFNEGKITLASHYQLAYLIGIIVLLIMLSGFFSCAETGLMAINRYRLRHKAQAKKRYAIIVLKLLKRPDRLLGVLLIGNNFANILASALATLVAAHLWGEQAALIVSIILTFIVLIFAEMAPKTIAALYPDKIAKWVAWPVFVLLKIFYPLVWLINAIANSLLRLLGMKVTGGAVEPLSREELRSVVYETSGRLSRDYQNMLLGILDLNKVTVKDVMLPKHDIVGIDLEWSWSTIQKRLAKSQYDWLPFYRESINQIVGVLHLRELTRLFLSGSNMSPEMLMPLLQEPYFVPEATPLNIQLMNFQRDRKRLAFVVDEYGEVQGLITVVDILEEIVGEFTTSLTSATKLIQSQEDGSYLVDGAITLRELNRLTQWQLPAKRARTLNGLITEYLEVIPTAGLCMRIGGFPIEIMEVKDNRVKVARIFPPITVHDI